MNLKLYITSAQDCDPGVCASIPGTIYNAELDQCAWADEVPGCGVEGKLRCSAFWNMALIQDDREFISLQSLFHLTMFQHWDTLRIAKV